MKIGRMIQSYVSAWEAWTDAEREGRIVGECEEAIGWVVKAKVEAARAGGRRQQMQEAGREFLGCIFPGFGQEIKHTKCRRVGGAQRNTNHKPKKTQDQKWPFLRPRSSSCFLGLCALCSPSSCVCFSLYTVFVKGCGVLLWPMASNA